jgi:hypothetical protein
MMQTINTKNKAVLWIPVHIRTDFGWLDPNPKVQKSAATAEKCEEISCL